MYESFVNAFIHKETSFFMSFLISFHTPHLCIWPAWCLLSFLDLYIDVCVLV